MQSEIATTEPEQTARGALPAIPVLGGGSGWALDAVATCRHRADALLDCAEGHYGRAAVRIGDLVSRAWLERAGNPYLAEMNEVAARMGRPGTYFLNASYEWSCTSRVAPSADGRRNRLIRVLDWPLEGLGRNLVAIHAEGEAGPWVNLAWPGFTGVVQALAPGRFAAVVNQGPAEMWSGLFALDWAFARLRLWWRTALTPAHLMRKVLDTARDYDEARTMLTETPVALPAIFVLCGRAAGEGCVIERLPDAARITPSPAAAANHWRPDGWRGHARGLESERRAAMAAAFAAGAEERFGWLVPPVLNATTRLAMVAEPESGRLWVQGFEPEGAATERLALSA